LADLSRLTRIILDKIEDGSENGLMDAKEIRLLGGTAIRSIRLYLKTLEVEHAREMKRADQAITGEDSRD
jgi:hypothetical protein